MSQNKKKRGCRDYETTINSDFNETSRPANQNGNGGGYHKTSASQPLTKVQRERIIREVENALPAYSSESFPMNGETITPTANQKKLKELLDEKTVVFVNGPFGSGKTFWTCLAGLYGLAEGKYDKIALTAPVVEADEKLGFLPGDKNDKMKEHVNQIIETMEDLVGKNAVQKMLDGGILEIAPHAFNRGRTYKKTFYILDESQNASARQLMTSLGRIGFGSTFVYMGDAKQNDRTTTQSAYIAFVERFSNAAYADYIGSVVLGKEDVRRHPLLQLIVERGDERALDGFENAHDAKIRTTTTSLTNKNLNGSNSLRLTPH